MSRGLFLSWRRESERAGEATYSEFALWL